MILKFPFWYNAGPLTPVSILVLMEYDLKVSVSPLPHPDIRVSILVLMEYDLKDRMANIPVFGNFGFNPCSNGI